MANNVTDRLLLKKIYDLYYDHFCSFNKLSPHRKSRIYVPIDCGFVGEQLNLDRDIVFGRLYYHLDKKHRYRQDDGSLVSLFMKDLAGDKHVIHFPLLAAVLAELEQDYYRYMIPLIISVGAFMVSVIALGWSDFFKSMLGSN